MISKLDSRVRRAAKTRIRISQQDKPRLSVFKSSQNMYAQIFDSAGSTVLVSASTNEKENKMTANNLISAKAIGQKIAERAIEAGIKKVVFDRSGYKYHGRIKAIAESAREAGLEF
jgi:large subunit ribosomal protein L18|tara:strand:- start:78 stop:425 length:348 start_codon:yes stop_codon:yes gene_type:complete